MTLDHALLCILAVALLVRYHRNALAQAEERFQKCDQERVQLHNFFYGREGVAFTDVRNEAEPIAETPLTPEDRYRERMDNVKQQLKRMARTRVSDLGPALRNLERQRRPRFRNIRPAMDPKTAAQVKDKIASDFAALGEQIKGEQVTRDQVKNGRS